MGFKHTGLFPEQAVNWDFARNMIKSGKEKINGRNPNVLNLFAYTGGATVACLKEGADVCHLDASKSIVTWAKKNVTLNSLENKNVRFIVDDAQKFVEREIKRNKKYPTHMSGIVITKQVGHMVRTEAFGFVQSIQLMLSSLYAAKETCQ